MTFTNCADFKRPGVGVYRVEWSDSEVRVVWLNLTHYALHHLVRQLHVWINSAFSLHPCSSQYANGDIHASHVFSLPESYICRTCTK